MHTWTCFMLFWLPGNLSELCIEFFSCIGPYFQALHYIIPISLGHVVNALFSNLLQDWTGLNFQTIMEEAEKIRNTVCIINI